MEEVLSRIGWGLYGTLLMIYASLCYFSNAISFMNLPLYLPIITCDIVLAENTVAAVDFCLYIGMAVGGFLLTSVSDVVGRKTIVAASLLLMFLSVLMASFAYGPFSLSVAMLLYGSGLGASLNVTKILVMESVPQKQRHRVAIFMDVLYLFGMIIALGFYWLLMPLLLQFYKENQRFLNWRVSVLFAVFPTIILACISSLVLDSPKYLLFERRPRDALEVIREMYAINKSKLFTTFQIAEGELHNKIADFGISSERDIPNTMSSRRLRIISSRIHKSLLVLVRKQFLRFTIMAIMFRLILAMNHVPLILLLARTLDLKEDMLTDKFLLWHFEHPIFHDCNHYETNLLLYRDFAILCSLGMLGCFILMMIVRCMERKFIMTSVLFLNGVFSLLLAVVMNHYIMRFAISALLVVTYSTAESCLDLIVLDMFPTAVRGTAMGETMIFARLANVFLIKYLTVSIQWVFIAFACLMYFGAILSFALPKFTNNPIVE